MAHEKTMEAIPAASNEVFVQIHGYDRRLEWSTLLRALKKHLECRENSSGDLVKDQLCGRGCLASGDKGYPSVA